MTEDRRLLAALILAGGAGSRLGGVDKAFVGLGGRFLIDHLLGRLAGQVRRLAVSANGDASRFAGFGLPVLADGDLAGKGPLAGVAFGLEWARGEGATELLTVPVDTPFVPRNLAERLGAAPCVAVWRGRQHHLVAAWPVDGLAALQAFLARPVAHKVRDALDMLGARQVAFDEAACDPFLNINTAADLDAAVARSGFAPEGVGQEGGGAGQQGNHGVGENDQGDGLKNA
jgi:molybdopterin-guanine dinucleotide biosynthesis protein A